MKSAKAYLVHACNISEVGGGIVLCRDEYAVTLCYSKIDHGCRCLIGVDAINFDYLHGMTFEPEILADKCPHVDDTEHVCLSRLNWCGKVLGIIHEVGVRNRLSPSWISYTDKGREKGWCLIMIPIRECQYSLLVILSFVRRIRIIDDQRSAQAIGVLRQIM